MHNKEKGNLGEKLAVHHILQKGYKILITNYRCAFGEIDIICSDGNTIVFIEVKLRKSLFYGYPREAVNSSKQKKIKKVALHYIYINKLTNTDFRFDVIEILDGKITEIDHIENAFM